MTLATATRTQENDTPTGSPSSTATEHPAVEDKYEHRSYQAVGVKLRRTYLLSVLNGSPQIAHDQGPEFGLTTPKALHSRAWGQPRSGATPGNLRPGSLPRRGCKNRVGHCETLSGYGGNYERYLGWRRCAADPRLTDLTPAAYGWQTTYRLIATIVLVTTFCISSSVAGQNSEPSGPDLRLQVRAAITQLSSPSRADRAKAEQVLTKLGPAILPLLPPPDLLESASVRVAIRRVRVRLEHDAAELSLRPSTVSLAGDFSVEEIVQQIEKQTGNAVSIDELSEAQLKQRSTVNLENSPFWSAIGNVEQTNLAASFDKETGLLTLHSGTSQRRESVTKIDRSFRIVASPFQPRGSVDNPTSLLSTQLGILCEPRLRPLFLKYETNDFKLAHSNGGQLTEPFNAGAKIEVPLGNGGREARLALSFLTQNPRPEKASIEGKVTILVAASEQPILFRNLGRAKRVSRRRGGVTVTINDVHFATSSPKSHDARVQLRVSYDLGAHAFESHQTWVFHNRVYLVDPDGKEHGPNGGFTTLHQGDGSVAIEYSFKDLPGDPAKWNFVYVAPTLLINVEIPIALLDIPVASANSTDD